MEKNVSPLVYLVSVVLLMCTIMSMSITTPHDRYFRFQRYDTVTTRKADWIYERLHFDETPIDVALIGTSRTGGGLSAPLIEKAFCEATGHDIHVANLSIPQTGRNMDYALAKEVLRTKAPSLIVVELNEVEPRTPHDGFVFLADAQDVLTAPVLINVNYLSDILRLPGRQAQLFFESLFRRPKLRRSFDRSNYPGEHLNRTEFLDLIDGSIISRDREVPAAKLDQLRTERLEKQKPVFMLPKFIRHLEYRFSRVYLDKIKTLTTSGGIETEFVYLPAFKAPAHMPPALKNGLRIDAQPISPAASVRLDPSFWLDATHVNAKGARIQSIAFALQLAARYPTLGVEGCNYAAPPASASL